jgi:deazaflavin-dependent oxidoreductase (nitroreductase family)
MAAQPNKVLRRLLHAPVHLYHWRCGFLLGRRFLLLRHVGRRSGRRRETVLEVMEYRASGPELVVMSAFGRRAGWLCNIVADPSPEVIVDRRRFVAAFRFLEAAEAIAVVRDYEQRNWLVTPIIRAVLSRLLGWHYRGTAGDHRRLVAELPLVAFRPRSENSRRPCTSNDPPSRSAKLPRRNRNDRTDAARSSVP